MNTLSKYKLWIGGAFCLVVIGIVIGATRPKRESGAQSGASPDVEVVQVEQKDVPIFGRVDRHAALADRLLVLLKDRKLARRCASARRRSSRSTHSGEAGGAV